MSITYMFRKFDPIKRMIISRDSGMINEYFTISKGQLIDLVYFATIGKGDNDQPQTYPVRDGRTGEILWVEEKDVKRYKSGKLDLSEVYQ